MKYLRYIFRNARRNPIRSSLTILSVSICLFLTMILGSFLAINADAAASVRVYNRIIAMSSQGFAQPVPIALLPQIRAMDGVVAATPFSWFGGKYLDEQIPFAQFGVDAESVFDVMHELKVPPDQLKAFKADKAGCVVGYKLAEDKGWKVGDRLPLKGDIYPFNLDLTIRGLYDGPSDTNLRMCFFHWGYLDDGLKTQFRGQMAGNAGMIFIKCENSRVMPTLCQAIDDSTRNSDSPTKTQTEEAFSNMFNEMLGDMKYLIAGVGAAVIVALVCVAGVAMAMSMRERVTEVAVLKAIGFGKRLVLGLVLAEAMLIAGLGGVLGALGGKAFFDSIDISPYTGGMLPFFYVPWSIALQGLAAAVLIGLVSGLLPAINAARMSVIDGLRRVV